MREIARGYALGTLIEVMHRTGDGARHGDTDDYGDNLHNDENRKTADQKQYQSFLRQVRLAIEDRGRDSRGPGAHIEKSLPWLAGMVPIPYRNRGEPLKFTIEAIHCRGQPALGRN